jgi:copper(I)-binding protein
MTANRFRPTSRVAAAVIAVLLAGGALAACGDDGETAVTGTSAPAEQSDVTTTVPSAVSVTGAWARTSPAVASAGAAYLEISNAADADDALVDVSVDASVAARAELHETSMGTGGMMAMNAVDEIAVPAGTTTVLEPGGYHIMLLELAAPLEDGSTIELTLTFREAGTLVTEAQVRDTAG